MGARAVNAALGVWLFFSSFMWPHTHAQRLNAWIVGIAVVAVALLALLAMPRARRINAVLGAWLILTALFVPSFHSATFWNHIVVGFGLALFGLSPSVRAIRDRSPVDA